MMEDLISRQGAIDAIRASTSKYTGFMEMEMYTDDDAVEAIEGVPSAQPEDWMERNKERILQAGMEGREIEFRIGGRLFAIREKAQ